MVLLQKGEKMKKFVVSYINFFSNDLESSIVEASNKIQSYMIFLKNKGFDVSDIEDLNEEELKQECFNMDFMVNSIEI